MFTPCTLPFTPVCNQGRLNHPTATNAPNNRILSRVAGLEIDDPNACNAKQARALHALNGAAPAAAATTAAAAGKGGAPAAAARGNGGGGVEMQRIASGGQARVDGGPAGGKSGTSYQEALSIWQQADLEAGAVGPAAKPPAADGGLSGSAKGDAGGGDDTAAPAGPQPVKEKSQGQADAVEELIKGSDDEGVGAGGAIAAFEFEGGEWEGRPEKLEVGWWAHGVDFCVC